MMTSPVVADQWAIDQGHGAAAIAANGRSLLAGPGADWPTVYLDLAQDCAAGQPWLEGAWVKPLQHLAPVSLEGALLAVTPMLLLNVNRYGHRQAIVQRWAADLGFSDRQVSAVGRYFQLLCGHSPRVTAPPWRPADPQPNDPLATGLAIVQATQGQFLPALQGVLSGQGTLAAVGLVGLLATRATGPLAIPLGMRQHYLETATLGTRWQHFDGGRLEQLADAVYHRWAGVGQAAVPDWGTAYNG